MSQSRDHATTAVFALSVLALLLIPIGRPLLAADSDLPTVAPPTTDAPLTSPTPAAEEAPIPDPAASSGAPDDKVIRLDDAGKSTDPPVLEADGNAWSWKWVPAGIIYHSYMAGPQEPRAAIDIFSESHGGTFGDATLGGRMGFLKYGNDDPTHPEGFQVDFYGAAIARLDLERQEDLDSCDYVFGLPFTYGNEVWQTKFGYAHLSSHMGDEFAIEHPGALNDRVNYTRDSLVWGNSYYPIPAWRVYGEIGWAAHCDGFAHRWTSQFGTELSHPGPTCDWSPFLAVNGRLREDADWVGDVNVQTGWLRRGILGQTLRLGFDYYNGKSSQSQFFNNYEQQIGAGVWYDF